MRAFINDEHYSWLRYCEVLVNGQTAQHCYGVDEEAGIAYCYEADEAGHLVTLGGTPLKVERHRLVLRLEGNTAALAGDRVSSRLKQLARLVGREPVVMT